MEAVKFKESNVVFAENQDEYKSLPAYIDNNGVVVTCWKLSEEEIKNINETGRIYLETLTFNNPLQPVMLTTDIKEIFK
jgi:hypothetical protein